MNAATRKYGVVKDPQSTKTASKRAYKTARFYKDLTSNIEKGRHIPESHGAGSMSFPYKGSMYKTDNTLSHR